MNPPEFKYSTGGASTLGDATTGDPMERLPGFLNHYSTTDVGEVYVEEVYAEAFAHFIASSKTFVTWGELEKVPADKAEQKGSLVEAFCAERRKNFRTAVEQLS